jgi:hypothetical protein
MKTYTKPTKTTDLRDHGRIILAWGEVTGHNHQIFADVEMDLPAADYFEEPGTGRRILLVTRPCVLRHQEHAPITLDPAKPVQARQGDVLLNPIGGGAWEVIRQREFDPVEVRQVAD